MKALMGHVSIQVSSIDALNFYKELLTYLGYSAIHEDEYFFGMGDEKGFSLWVSVVEDKYKSAGFHRKHIGLNHFAFQVTSREDVDKFVEEFMKPRNITPLYESPKTYPEYTPEYYAVFFEDMDRIKIEIAFM